MKQPKEKVIFKCTPHQAHLIRKYAKSIMCEETNEMREHDFWLEHTKALRVQREGSFVALAQLEAQKSRENAFSQFLVGGLFPF